MKSVLTMSGSPSHEVSNQTLFAAASAGLIVLIALASLTAPIVDRSCTSTLANRAVVQCVIHAK